MKKILIIHNKYRLPGGEDIAVSTEEKILNKYFNTKLIYFENTIDNFVLQFFYFLINKNFSSIKKIKKVISEFNPDAVYIHNTWFKVSPGIFNELFKLDIPVFLKLHNYRFFCTKDFMKKNHFGSLEFCKGCGLYRNELGWFNKYFIDSYLRSFLIAIYGHKYYKILKNSKLKIFCLTNFQKEFLIRHGFDSKKIFVHRNYIQPESREQKSTKLEKEYIVYAGRISKEKGIQFLLDSYLQSDLKFKYNFKLIGDGPELKKLKKSYKQNGIEFLGQIDNLTSVGFIKNSSLVVTASQLYECQPTLLCEASSLGIPSLFPSNDGIQEFFPKNYKLVFDQNDKGSLVKVFDEILERDDLDIIGKENKVFLKKLLNIENYLYNFQNITRI